MKCLTSTALALAGVALIVGTGCTPPSSSTSPTAKVDRTTQPVVSIPPAPTTEVHPATAAPTTAAPTTVAPVPTPTTSPLATPASGIQVGPGPQAIYTVQPQPAPGSCHYAYVGPYPLPDPHCTPGRSIPRSPRPTSAPPSAGAGTPRASAHRRAITEPEKEASAAAYGYTGPFSTAEYDHLIPLELGGDPNDPANLWVEPPDNPDATSTANTKDLLENRLNRLVCAGQLTLAAAQQAIATDWVAAYERYGGQAYGGEG